jgi:eukaryotic-like serine/threonine-protein kinase
VNGYGVVYKARHLALKRTVALKMIRACGHTDPAELARFRLEAEAVARLQHPNIVQIHEVGEAGGLPYCALEFVEGGSLAGKIDGKPLPAREAAKLVEALARAVQLAHSRNVVHRDLKPANVLLTAYGTPKVTDFGLARQLDSDSGATQAGAVMGTPSYMAPEQASGSSHEAGPAADIYALGAILYECLAGRPPFKGKTVVETLDQVRTQEPAPPSRFRAGVPLDLETICLKCLRKEPEKRYVSAAELAGDLVRYQCGEPIQARPVGVGERVLKWVRRRPMVAALVGLVFLATAAGLGGIAWAYGEALAEKKAADNAKDDALKQKKAADDAKDDALKQKNAAEQALANSQVMLADAAWRGGNVGLALDRLDEVPADLRRWEWRYLKRTSSGSLFTLYEHTGPVYSVAFSPDGARLASGSHDGTVKVWDARTGQELRTLKGHTDVVRSVAFSPDGARLASGSEGFDRARKSLVGEVKVWDARTGQELLTLKGHTGYVSSVAFSPDGARLASGSSDKTVRVWDARTGQELHTLKGHTGVVTSVAFSPEGQRVVTRDQKGETIVWDLTNGQRLDEPVPKALVWDSARSPDGRLVVRIDRDTVRLIGPPPDAEELLVRHAQTRLDADWHRDQAARWEKDKQWQTAAFHLEHALRAQPGDGDLARRLTAALAQSADSNRTVTNAATWRRLALVHLHTGQGDAYRRTCQQMQERFAVPGEAKQAAFLLAGPPGLGLAANRLALTDSAFGCGLLEWQQTIRAAVLQPGVLKNPQTWLARLPKDDKLLRGAILCRCDEPILARAELADVRDPVGLLFRALAEQGRGNKEAARAALAEARKMIPQEKIDLIEQTPLPWLEMVETRVLLKDLETLLSSN